MNSELLEKSKEKLVPRNKGKWKHNMMESEEHKNSNSKEKYYKIVIYDS